ncbi:MAG: chromosomal replication initiator DnaA [Rubellimicrobium sp.]|nr:chromosomal replication initiator DnaA [Rubellimicrobium sp.]
MGAGDFFVSGSNRAAHAMVTGGGWPGGRLALTGARGAGKTHLAHIWAGSAAARVIAAAGFHGGELPAPGAALVIEDMESLPRAAEEPLFHLLNHLAATGGRILVTAASPPAAWTIALPDLASRLQAFPLARIEAPDDALLAAILAKLFADRGLAPEPGLIPWLVARMERSFAAARDLALLLEATALSEGRALTLPYARAVLMRAGVLDKGGDASA